MGCDPVDDAIDVWKIFGNDLVPKGEVVFVQLFDLCFYQR
jgi:hypothetical protein